MKGSITKRCGCAAQYSESTGKRKACKREHGSWSFVVGVRDPATGKRRQVRESKFATKAEADKRLAELVDQSAKGTVPARKRETFATFAAAWLQARSRRVRPVTVTCYRTAITHANAAFGALPIGDVTRRDVERLAHGMTDRGLAQRTVSITLTVVRSIFARALNDGLIARNPAADVDAVGRPPAERGALSAAELATLREHLAGDRLAACWLLTLYGLRRSEVMGLRWPDVDLAMGTLSITRGVVADGKGKRSPETPTKTRKGTRTLPLPADVLTALRGLREHQAAEFGFEQVRTGWLAIDELGVPLRPERWSDMWRALCRAAGVEPVTLHVARHSSVTAMRDAEVSDHLVAKWHGHDENVMRGIYTHSEGDALAAAGQALADVLGGAR